MEGLYTNRNTLSDFVKNGILSAIGGGTDVYIAVAFFTEPDVVQEMIKEGCRVRMVVRLGFPTNPLALKKLMNNSNVEIRFFTDKSFHPKLYIFGNKLALVGSANLTTSAILTNQEVVVSVASEDERFSELAALFSDYWEEANVLTEDDINKYESIYNRHKSAVSGIGAVEDEVVKSIGKVVFSNINRGKTKKSKESIFIESYRRTYQEAVTAFNKIREVYESVGRRKVDEDKIPLRLEIDSFLSFVRDEHASHEIWREQPLGWDESKRKLLRQHIQDWFDTKWEHFEETIVRKNYPLIKHVFSSPETIEASDSNNIVNALVVLHSFHDRLRFFQGGLEALKKSFAKQNELRKIKDSFIHLLFGKGDVIRRMCDLIYDNSYKLNEFGQANVQELVGWVNKEELPVVNGRTTKVLRYYGFDVRQLS
ncbi:MAG: phospholipase D-like domain-containing protein [Nanoarchaeota archaeon]